jgi:hypothetical protein
MRTTPLACSNRRTRRGRSVWRNRSTARATAPYQMTSRRARLGKRARSSSAGLGAVPADAALDLVVVGDRLDDNLDVECPLAPQAPLVPHQKVLGAASAGRATHGWHVVDSAGRPAAQRVPFGSTRKAFGPTPHLTSVVDRRRTLVSPIALLGRAATYQGAPPVALTRERVNLRQGREPNMCQSCDRVAATVTASFSDGTALVVCSTCAVTARVMGAALEAACQPVA